MAVVFAALNEQFGWIPAICRLSEALNEIVSEVLGQDNSKLSHFLVKNDKKSESDRAEIFVFSGPNDLYSVGLFVFFGLLGFPEKYLIKCDFTSLL